MRRLYRRPNRRGVLAGAALLGTARFFDRAGGQGQAWGDAPYTATYAQLGEVVGMENRVVAVPHKALADPARGCKLT
jgi:hypothetical protein